MNRMLRKNTKELLKELKKNFKTLIFKKLKINVLKITAPLEEARKSTHLKDFFIYLYHWVPNSRQEFSLYTGILANKWQADGIIVLSFCNSLWTNQSRHWGIHIWLKGQLDIMCFWTEDHSYYYLWNSCKKNKIQLESDQDSGLHFRAPWRNAEDAGPC